MAYHLDGRLFRNTFGTPAMREVFSEDAFIGRFLEVEAALARAEAEIGLVPDWAAETITERATVEYVDYDRVGANLERTGLVSMSIIDAWKDALGDAGEYVHYGATSQDIYDTALVLQLRKAFALIVDVLDDIIDELVEMAAAHRATPMIGRTHYVHATPITFGLKVAVWADEFDRHRERFEELSSRLFVLQFFGATGTLASLGDDGFEVQRRLGDELGLDVPAAPWFAARDRFAEAATVLAMVASTASKIAQQILFLNRPEIGEVSQHVPDGAVGSSTMPHKQNPTTSEKVVGLASVIRANADVMLKLMETDDERSASTFYMEFAVIPEVFTYASRSLENTRELIHGLEVHPAAMEENIQIFGDLIASERVMMALAEFAGRQTAHELIYEHSMAAAQGNGSLAERLIADPVVTEYLSDDEIRELTDPTGYLGSATEIVNNLLAELER